MEEAASGIRPADATSVTVSQCPACKADHGQVELTAYLSDRMHPFTHFFTCSVTNEPVNVSLIFDDKGKLIELDSELVGWIVEACRGDHYMAVVWTLDAGLPQMKRKTAAFPTVHFQECVSQLDKNLKDEVGPPEPGQMRRAALPEPVAQLFGDDIADNKDGQ